MGKGVQLTRMNNRIVKVSAGYGQSKDKKGEST